MDNYKEKSSENASQIKREIERLRYNHCVPNSPTLDPNYLYRDFFNHAKEITELFKTLKPIIKDDRERLWSEYRNLCDKVSSKQNTERNESSRNRGNLEALINDAYHKANGAGNREGLDSARAFLTEILGYMKEKRLLKNDREYLWENWVRASGKLKSSRERIQRDGYIIAKHNAEGCSDYINENPYDALKRIKEVQSEIKGMYMNREQRGEVYEILNRIWESASSKIGVIKEEKRKKQEDWKERTGGNIERWEKNVEKAEDTISHIKDNITKLEDEAANARTDEHTERVRGWIEEGYQKISDIENSISGWEERISSVKEKLR
mgnify:CR=1 FL=1